MMRRIWAGIAATWAVIAIFVVLAAAQRPVPTGVPVSPGSAAVHATTSSSTVASSGPTGGGQVLTYVKAANGALVPVGSTAPVATVTRTS